MGQSRTRLQCKSYKFGSLVWGTICNLMSHVYVFITRTLAHHKNKSSSLETRLWKDISHQTLQSNSYSKIEGFYHEGWSKISHGKLFFRLPFLFLLTNQKYGDEDNINTWRQEPYFIQNQKPTLQALTLQRYGFAPFTRWRRDLRKGVFSQGRLIFHLNYFS